MQGKRLYEMLGIITLFLPQNSTHVALMCIIQKNLHIIQDDPIYPKGSILVANKRENNLKYLRGDPYSIKDDLTNNVELGYVKCDRKCDSCQQFVEETSCITSHATRRKFKINRDITCIYYK